METTVAENSGKRASGRPFEKGQSGNPGGRPKGTSFAAAIAKQLEIEHTPGMTTREHIVARVVALALRGDLDAAKWLADRSEGKTPEKMSVDATVKRIEVVYDDADRLAPAPSSAVARQERGGSVQRSGVGQAVGEDDAL